MEKSILGVKEALARTVGEGMTGEQLQRLEKICRIEEFSDEQEIIGRFGKSMDPFVVLEGWVRVVAMGKEFRRGGPGSFMGEIALIDGAPRSASVRSVGTTKIGFLGARELHAEMNADPSLAAITYRNIAKELSKKLRTSTSFGEGFLYS